MLEKIVLNFQLENGKAKTMNLVETRTQAINLNLIILI